MKGVYLIDQPADQLLQLHLESHQEELEVQTECHGFRFGHIWLPHVDSAYLKATFCLR